MLPMRDFFLLKVLGCLWKTLKDYRIEWIDNGLQNRADILYQQR